MELQSIIKRLDAIEGLPTLPSIAIEVNHLLENYETSIEQLTRVIEKDPAIVVKILKLVNSAFYGFRSKVSNISNAIILMGYNTVRNAIISVSVINAFQEKQRLDGFNIIDFWKHSIAVAVTSKHIANSTQICDSNDAFTAGLLHDIGKFLMAQFFSLLFKTAYQEAKALGVSFYEAEKKTLPITHPVMGSRLAENWHLPEALIAVIKYHHHFNTQSPHYNLLATVHVADTLCNHFIDKQVDSPDRRQFDSQTFRFLKLIITSSAQWYPDVSISIQDACRFFLQE
jgi:putative nucleotidyltransferase with HDIG domain